MGNSEVQEGNKKGERNEEGRGTRKLGRGKRRGGERGRELMT